MPAMPHTTSDASADYYTIAVRQFRQQILPLTLPPTTVWGYGSVSEPGTFSYPAQTIEATAHKQIRVTWVNQLVDGRGKYLPHLLPVDQTLHWANPAGGLAGRDGPGRDPEPYRGPVPIVTHVHGGHNPDESDGYPEAWYLPAAANIPDGYARTGGWYEFYRAKFSAAWGGDWTPGSATFVYPNDQRATALWYHDHSLGMTRVNVYAGPAGFYIVRGGPAGDGAVLDSRTGQTASLPGPAPREGDKFPPNKPYREIPIAIQDRAFNEDASLFYPDTRVFFDGIVRDYIPDGEFSPIWNPEFFGNMIMVNGNTWPFLNVEQRRYRFRFLNGCQSRFLILDFNDVPGVEAWQIGNEGGFLAAPVNLTADNGNRLLMGLAERADVIVDFTNVPVGNHVLRNVGPDEPFGGGEPGEPPEGFEAADPDTTGQIMQFRVVPALSVDASTPPQFLQLPAITPLPAATVTRQVALIEKAGVGFDAEDEPVEGPVEALLGTVDDGELTERLWMDPVTENPAVGARELWEMYNATADAHPMHIHEITFEIVNRQDILIDEETQTVQLTGSPTPPEPWENGFKDTVVAYPGQVTRLRAQFKTPGQFVWHCHIVEHEDNEMMRPYRIGPVQPGQPE